METTAAWMVRAYRGALAAPELVEREQEDLDALAELGVRVLTPSDEGYPPRLADEDTIVLQVAGRPSLLHEEGVEIVAGHRGAAAQRLVEVLDGGGRAVMVVSKGLLQARTLLRALGEALRDGSVAVVSREPPRATWGPVRDRRRDALAGLLRGA